MRIDWTSNSNLEVKGWFELSYLKYVLFRSWVKLVVKDTGSDRIRISHHYSFPFSHNRPRTVLEKQCYHSPILDNMNTVTKVKIFPYGISHRESRVKLLYLKPLGIVLLCVAIFQNVWGRIRQNRRWRTRLKKEHHSSQENPVLSHSA